MTTADHSSQSPKAGPKLPPYGLSITLAQAKKVAAAANEMMNACRGLGLDRNDFVVAHQVYRLLGGQSR